MFAPLRSFNASRQAAIPSRLGTLGYNFATSMQNMRGRCPSLLSIGWTIPCNLLRKSHVSLTYEPCDSTCSFSCFSASSASLSVACPLPLTIVLMGAPSLCILGLPCRVPGMGLGGIRYFFWFFPINPFSSSLVANFPTFLEIAEVMSPFVVSYPLPTSISSDNFAM